MTEGGGVITDEDAERTARAGRRLADALQPADDAEERALQCLSQVLAPWVVEHLADMAERVARPTWTVYRGRRR